MRVDAHGDSAACDHRVDVHPDHRPTRARVVGAPDFGSLDPLAGTLHAGPRAALRWVLGTFDRVRAAASASVWIDSGPKRGRAEIYRDDDKVVLIVGHDSLARTVLPGLFPLDGWTLHRTPIPGTPLSILAKALGPRAYNILAREGFTTVEEVVATPEAGLRDIRGMGDSTIEIVHTALGTARRVTYTYPDDDELVTLSGRQVRELGSLLSTLTMYAQARGTPEVVRRTEAFIADALPQLLGW